MRKYFAYIKVSIQNALAYRGPMMVWLIGNVISLVIIVSVWFAVESAGQIGGYSRNELISYGVFALFLNYVVNWLPYYWVKDEIARGDIVGSTLLKPVSFFWKVLAHEIGWHSVSIWIGITAFLVASFFIRDYLVFPTGTGNLFLLFLAMLLAVLLNLTMSLCLGMVAFWTPRIGQLDGVFWITRTLFGGQGLPISFFPQIFQPMIKVLPFRYMFSFPIEIFLGKLSVGEIFLGYLTGIIWLLSLVLLYKLMWLKGRQVFTAYGQ